MNRIKVCCCLAAFALSATAQPRPDEGMDDFLAVSNSVHKAARTLPQDAWYSLRNGTFEQLRFIFDMMSALSTSKVEVICYQGLGFGPESLVYWMTGEAVYKMNFPRDVFLERGPFIGRDGKKVCYPFKYNLSISKTVRTKTFDTELEAFESIPGKRSGIRAVDAPCGFYARRKSDGTFESIYFPVVTSWKVPIPDDADDERKEMMKVLNERARTDKMCVFSCLLERFGEWMEKPVVWSDDDIPRTVTERQK